jgi:hypothetical protein
MSRKRCVTAQIRRVTAHNDIALEISVDGVTEDEVRSEPGKEVLSCQHNDGFAWVRSRGTRHREHCEVIRWTYLSPKGSRTAKMARPPHNSG